MAEPGSLRVSQIEMGVDSLAQAVLARLLRYEAFDAYTPVPALVRMLEESAAVLVRMMDGEELTEDLVDELGATAWLAANDLTVRQLNDVEVAFIAEADVFWASRRIEAVSAAKSITLAFCDGYWPFEHSAAVRQAVRFGRLIDHIPAPVFVANERTEIVAVTPELEQVTGRCGSILGMTVTALFGNDVSLTDGASTLIDFDRGDHHRQLDITVDATELPTGVEYFGFVRDRSRELALEQVRDGVVGAISHELRTPLTAVIGYLELLQSNALDGPSRAEALSVAKSEARLLQRLVGDIVDYSALESDSMEMKVSKFSARDVLEAASRRVFRSDDTCSVDVGEDFCIEADRDRIAQVLTNLLTNAQRYGGPHVSVSARHDADAVVIEVADDGAGVPEHELDSIFAPFVQGSARHTGDGAGLGLAICSAIVASHGGTITVTNEPGARFVVTLPVRRSHDE